MTVTRHKLIALYATQVISLLALGFYVAIQNSYSDVINNKWSRIHHQLITDRRGIVHLHSRLNGIDIISLLSRIRSDYYDINQVELQVINHGGNDNSLVKENVQHHEIIRDALQRGINNHDNFKNGMAFPLYVTSSTSHKIDNMLLDCRIVDFFESTSHLEHYDSFNYPMHILHNCDIDDSSKIKVDINEFGTIIVRFAKHLSWQEKMFAFENSIPEFLSSWLQPLSSTNNPESSLRAENELSFASMKIISTLVDADPMSYPAMMRKNESVTPLYHYELLSKTFQNEMTTSITSIANQLSTGAAKSNDNNQTLGLYQSLKLNFHGVTYVGQDLASESILNEYEENIPSDYTIPLKKASDLIKNGEIGQSIGLHDGSGSIVDSDETIDEIVWNLVFFLPPKPSTPLYIQSDGFDDESSWSPAIAITRMNTILSIVNINHDEDQMDNIEEEYQFAIRQSISYVGSHIRTKLGLSSIPLDAQGKQSFNDDLTVEYYYALPTSYGISPWEVDLLIRQSWSIKVEKIIKSIEEVVSLTKARKSIAFPIKVRLYCSPLFSYLMF
jgi:hypothetical protein